MEFNWPNGPESCGNQIDFYSEDFKYYCKDHYCKSIAALVYTNTQFLSRASSARGKENNFHPNSGMYATIKQLICDVNHAYDCAGLNRPIIQAAILENVSDQINQLAINTDLLNSYEDALGTIEPPAVRDYYFNNQNSPLLFDKERMLTFGKFKFENIETKVWFWLQATTYIDFGYTSLHMGQFSIYAKPEPPNDNFEDFAFFLDAVRDYADEAGSFIIIGGEDENNGEPAYVNNTMPEPKSLLFDFGGAAIRPREVVDPPEEQTTGDYNDCDTNVDNTVFEGTPCDSDVFSEILEAIIDSCVIYEGGVGTAGGIHPLGCNIEHQPYYMYFDFGSGIVNNGSQVNWDCEEFEIYWNQLGVASNEPQSLTWGYEDTRWFATQLSKECRAWWWEYFYCNGRELTGNPHGFLQIPAVLILKFIENYKCIDDIGGDGRYLLSDDPCLMQSVDQTLSRKISNLDIEEVCTDLFCVVNCNGINAPEGFKFRKGRRWYKLHINNTDCSSTYTIHMQDPFDNWMGFTYGDYREFKPTVYGTYHIIIRQDNMEIMPYGVEEFHYYLDFYEYYCCQNLIPAQNCYGLYYNQDNNFNQVNLNYELEIYPNPAINVLHIENLGSPILEYGIIGLNGEIIWKENVALSYGAGTSISTNIDVLKSGMYFLRVKTQDQEYQIEKFVIEN